jgi:hypothetical protein
MNGCRTATLIAGLLAFTASSPGADPPPRLAAKVYDSGFALAHDTYNSMGVASDGRIYYVLSSEAVDKGAEVFRFNPATGKIDRLGDLTEAAGEKGANAIVQGKSHVTFVESKGKLYFATHIGYYSIIDGMEKMGVPPAGMKPYPGGHLLSLDPATGKFEDLAIAPEREGIITMNMDPQRQRIYGITWPTGYFFRYDLPRKELKNLGRVADQGENGVGARYQTICRSLAIDPRDGAVYFSNSKGDISRYRYDRDTLEVVAGVRILPVTWVTTGGRPSGTPGLT